MIESEEKRKRIADMLERWSKHCKVDHLLREGDIPGIVDSIITEFYHMKLCCGHWVNTTSEGIDLQMDEDEGYSTGIYCKECAEKLLKDSKHCRKV